MKIIFLICSLLGRAFFKFSKEWGWNQAAAQSLELLGADLASRLLMVSDYISGMTD